KPQSIGSAWSSACTAAGTIPQPVHKGALTPATADEATVVERDSPPGKKLQNSKGAGTEMLVCTNVPGPQAVVAPESFCDAESRPAKQVTVPDGITVDPKL